MRMSKKNNYILEILLVIIISALIIALIIVFNVKDKNLSDKNGGFSNKNIVLKVGGLENMEPYSYFNNYGKYIGYSVDIMDEIAKKLDITIVYSKVTFDNFMEKLENGDVDVVLGIQYDSAYSERLKFSKPFIENKFNIFVKYHNNSIRNIDDLSGKKISLYINDPSYQKFRDRNDMRIFRCESEGSAYDLLKTEMADAFIANKDLAMNFVSDDLLQKKLKIVGEDYLVMPSAIAATDKNSYIIEYLNVGIDEIVKNGKLEDINEKWFGQKITEKPEFLYHLIAIIAGISLSLFLIILVIARINNMLKQEVNERTHEIRKEMKFKEDIMNSFFNSIITLDNDMRITFINDRAQKYSLVDEEDVINKLLSDTVLADLFSKEDISGVIKNKERIINREKTIEKDNIKRYVEYNVFPLLECDEIIGITIVYRDITDEKMMRERIMHKDKMASIGRLTAGIAHEIRNPLTSIDMYIKLLPENIEDGEFRKSIVTDIPNEISRLNNLITSLLDYAKPRPSDMSAVDLKHELDFILRLLKNDIEKNKVSISENIKENVRILFDGQQFRQVIINILINAIEALKEVENPSISITCEMHDNRYIITITNNGYPIKSEIADLIFEPFFSTKVSGYGLGLSMVSQLCKENNAEIFLDKDFLHGARFNLIVDKYYGV